MCIEFDGGESPINDGNTKKEKNMSQDHIDGEYPIEEETMMVSDEEMTNVTEDVEESEIELKFAYTEDEILELSREELMDIISIKTSDDVIIYFDLISSIEIDQVIMKSSENIPIAQYETYEIIQSKFARFKLFKIMHDVDGNISSLQKAEQKLEKMIVDRIDGLELLFNTKTTTILEKIDYEISQVRDSVISKIDPAVNTLTNVANKSNIELDSALKRVKNKVDSLDSSELQIIISKLSKVSELLAEVVE